MGSSALLRRGVVATTVLLGLLLMHGGIGPAAGCAGMAPMSAGSMTGPGRAAHHPPGEHPSAAHNAQMCLSTPAASSADVVKAAACVDRTSAAGGTRPATAPTVTSTGGRAPPAPDPVSVLCVHRV